MFRYVQFALFLTLRLTVPLLYAKFAIICLHTCFLYVQFDIIISLHILFFYAQFVIDISMHILFFYVQFAIVPYIKAYCYTMCILTYVSLRAIHLCLLPSVSL